MYQQGQDSLKCIVQYTGTFLGFKDPHVTILFKDGKFSLAEWQMIEDMGDKVDLANAISEASEGDGSGCKKLVDFVFDKAIKTKFNFTLGDASTKGGSLQVQFKWTYDITVTIPGTSDLHILGLTLPDLPLVIPPPYKLGELEKLLVNTILASTVEIGAVLLDKKNLPHFMILIAVMGAESWTKETISRLLCRKANTNNVEQRGEEIAEEESQQMDEPDTPGNTATNAATATIAATGLGAALAGLPIAVDAGAAFTDFLSGALALLGALISAFPDNTKFLPLQKTAKDRGQVVNAAVQSAQDYLEDLLNLSVVQNPPSSSFVSSETYGSTVQLNWEANKPNKSGFDYENFENVVWEVRMGLVDDVNDPSLHNLTSDAFSTTYADPSFLFGATVYSWVRARAFVAGQTYYSKTWARAQPAVHIPWLRPVPQVEFLLSPSVPYSCTVSAPDSPVGKYHVQVIGTNGSSTTVLYEADPVVTSAGALSLNIGIFDLAPVTSPITSCMARVKVVSPDPTTFHDSPYTDSSMPIPVTSPIPELQVPTRRQGSQSHGLTNRFPTISICS